MDCKVLFVLALTAFALAECRSSMSMESSDEVSERRFSDLQNFNTERRESQDDDTKPMNHFDGSQSRQPGQTFQDYVVRRDRANLQYDADARKFGPKGFSVLQTDNQRSGAKTNNQWSDEDIEKNRRDGMEVVYEYENEMHQRPDGRMMKIQFDGEISSPQKQELQPKNRNIEDAQGNYSKVKSLLKRVYDNDHEREMKARM